MFCANGLLFASWTAHIPQFKAHLDLTDGTLGLALLGAPAGSVSAMILSARLLARFGSRRMVQAALLGYCAAGPLVGLTGSLLALFAALYAWGAFQGALDVSMNTQAIAVEQARGRPLMPGLHGWWSIGAFAGAGLGAAGVAIGLSLTSQLLLLGVPALVVAGRLSRWMIPDVGWPAEQNGGQRAGQRKGQRAPRRFTRRTGQRPPRRFTRPVLMLGAIAFASMLCEGASADWAAVYLRGPLHTSAAVAGLGYAAFSLAMLIVRMSGNRLLARFPVRVVSPVLAAIAAVGFTAGLLDTHAGTAIAGFGCLGIGMALVIPAVFSAAGRLPGISPGSAIVTVSAFGWTGFVCGPPLIGALASATSLSAALGLLPALTTFIAVAAALAPALRSGPPGIQP